MEELKRILKREKKRKGRIASVREMTNNVGGLTNQQPGRQTSRWIDFEMGDLGDQQLEKWMDGMMERDRRKQTDGCYVRTNERTYAQNTTRNALNTRTVKFSKHRICLTEFGRRTASTSVRSKNSNWGSPYFDNSVKSRRPPVHGF